MLLIKAGYLIAEGGSEVFFISEDYVNKRSETPVCFLCLGFPSNRFPQRRSIVEIVGNDGAGMLRRLNGLLGNEWRSFRKSAIDSARVKPAHSVLAKNLVPVDIAGFQL